MIEAGQKIIAAGMKLSAMLYWGWAVASYRSNMRRTAPASPAPSIHHAQCAYTDAAPGTPLRAEAEQGLFQPLSPYEFVLELKELLSNLNMQSPCIFRSNHVSNMLPLAGTLPEDKDSLLRQAEAALQLLKNQNRPTFNDDGPF
jgi:hypothetical protein